MKKLFVFFITVCFFASTAVAQHFAWAKKAGSYAFDLGYGVGTDNAGNVYIAGKYELNGAKFGNVSVSCAGNHDMYLAKYGPGGDFRWVRTAGGRIGDYAHCLAVDGAGNSYVAGEFEVTAKFGNVSLTTFGSNDIFIAKYDPNGNLLWAKRAGSNGDDKGLGICVKGDAVYLTGYIGGSANFSGLTVSTSGNHDIVVAKYNTGGAIQWVRKAGGSGLDEGNAVDADAAGNCYVTGFFSGSANFSGTSLGTNGSKDIFVAKYSSGGGLVWVKKAGGSASDQGNGIKVNSSGGVFVTGGFRVRSFFGSITMTAQRGDADIFVARYDAGSGNCIWARKAGGPINDHGRALALDGASNVYITGNHGYGCSFGAVTLNSTDETDIYFASYDAGGGFRWALRVGGAFDAADPDRFLEMGLSIATDPSGNVIGSGAFRSSSSFGGTTLSSYNNHTDVYVTKIVQGGGRELNPVVSPTEPLAFCKGNYTELTVKEDSGTTYTWVRDGVPIEGANASSYRATIEGEYAVVANRGDLYVQSSSTKVQIQENVIGELAKTAKIDCINNQAVLRAEEHEDNVYKWSINDKIIEGATASSYVPKENGDYRVEITRGSCSEWSPVMHVEEKDCAMPGVTPVVAAEENDISIHPNPNNGLFTMDINLSGAQQPEAEIKVEVVNSMGDVVYSETINSAQQSLSHHIELGSSAKPGVYYVHIAVGDKIEKTRIILVRE